MRASSKPKFRATAALTFLTVLLAGASARADTVALRADEWCPYNCAPESDRPGYAVEIAREVFAAAGRTLDYDILTCTRSVEDARTGRYAGVIGALVEDASGFVFPAEPVGATA